MGNDYPLLFLNESPLCRIAFGAQVDFGTKRDVDPLLAQSPRNIGIDVFI